MLVTPDLKFTFVVFKSILAYLTTFYLFKKSYQKAETATIHYKIREIIFQSRVGFINVGIKHNSICQAAIPY